MKALLFASVAAFSLAGVPAHSQSGTQPGNPGNSDQAKYQKQVLKSLANLEALMTAEGAATRNTLSALNADLTQNLDLGNDADGILLEIRKYIEGLQDFSKRLENDWTITLTNADDGFTVYLEGQELGRDRGTASGYNPAKRFNLYDEATARYFSAFKHADADKLKIWRPIVEKITTGQPVNFTVECWNAGGPSQVTYGIETNAISGGLGNRRYVGSNAGGACFTHTYTICYDTLLEQDILMSEGKRCPAQ
jgi:hypothetical protein